MDTTKTDQPTDRTAQPAEAEEATAEGVPNAVSDRKSQTEAPAGKSTEKSAAAPATDSGADAATDDSGADGLDEPATAPATALAASTGVFSGAAAVASAGLGLASLTGTWLGTMLQERAQLTGQIKAQSGAAANQIEAVYGTPWHTTAFLNGLFGLAAVVIAAVVLLRQRSAASASGANWVSAVAWGAVALGIIGLLIAAVMGLDVFTPMPKVPASPGGAPTG
ncbi:hypothetical protein ACH4TX_36420 [Streptomyces sp. NPDC021098]|uniref:hypothetical protein n=1 Tax=unclassified Streptomyces TaxID=2593676 RepID=UPI0037A4433D